jgi:hypothetical protein
MSDSPQSAESINADSHVRLYHGKLTALPRRYVARERLSLRRFHSPMKTPVV